VKKLKPIVLAVATAIVVGVSIYLRYFSGTRLRAPGETAPATMPSAAVGGAPAENEVVAGDAARPGIREVPRIAINGLMGDLAYVQKRMTDNGKLVVARLKLGRDAPTRAGVAREPVAQVPGSMSE